MQCFHCFSCNGWCLFGGFGKHAIACNERRKAAELILREHHLHDEESLAIITQQHPEQLIQHIVAQEIEARIGCGEPVAIEVKRLKQALAETQKQLSETGQDLEQLESMGRGAVDKILALEEAVANLQASKATLRRECAEELRESREALADAEVTIEILKQCIENKSLKKQPIATATVIGKASTVVDDVSTHRTETSEPFSDCECSSDEQYDSSTGREVFNNMNRSQASKNAKLKEQLLSNKTALESAQLEVKTLQKDLTELAASLAVANSKLVFMRETILSVVPAALTSEN